MKRYWPVLRHWSIISLFFLGFAFPVYADWNSFIINYNKNLYGKGSQTWQIASYDAN